MKTTNNNHGGPGRNQGRKPKPKNEKRRSITIRLPPETIAALKARGRVTAQIEEGIALILAK